MEGVLLFLFRLGSPLLMAVGQGSLFGLILSEVVVDPVPELVRQVLLFHPAAEVMGVLVPDGPAQLVGAAVMPILEVGRHIAVFALAHICQRRVNGNIGGVGFGRGVRITASARGIRASGRPSCMAASMQVFTTTTAMG